VHVIALNRKVNDAKMLRVAPRRLGKRNPHRGKQKLTAE
jgi:hypothetical protein